MAAGNTAGKKTGPKPSFTRDDVVDAAMAIGLDEFTLAQVAERIGVVTSAVYRRFASRNDLLDACLARVADTLAAPSSGMRWQEVCHLWADECWRMCEEFPGLARVLYSYATGFTNVERRIGVYIRVLGESGITPRQAAFALDFLGDTVLASRLGVEGMREVDASGATGLDRVRQRVGGDSPFQPEESWCGRGFTDVKVNFIIEGLERHWPEL